MRFTSQVLCGLTYINFNLWYEYFSDLLTYIKNNSLFPNVFTQYINLFWYISIIAANWFVIPFSNPDGFEKGNSRLVGDKFTDMNYNFSHEDNKIGTILKNYFEEFKPSVIFKLYQNRKKNIFELESYDKICINALKNQIKNYGDVKIVKNIYSHKDKIYANKNNEFYDYIHERFKKGVISIYYPGYKAQKSKLIKDGEFLYNSINVCLKKIFKK